MTTIAKTLEKRFGERKYFQTSGLVNGNIYLNHTNITEAGLSVKVVQAVVREAAYDSGVVQYCFTREQLLEGRAPGLVGELVLKGYNAERSGDLVVVLKPFVVPGTGKTGTTHGSPWSYDTRVPILFYGKMFNPGRYNDPFNITDIAPTMAVALGINEPAGSVGKPLPKILKAR